MREISLLTLEYQNFLKIYTDGSKDPQNNTIGCAFVIPELKVSKGYKLQSHMSIFMCELTAIYLALSWIQDFKPLNTVIFVDSLSALQAIRGSIYKVKNHIIYDILYRYIMFGRGICEKYQSRDVKFLEPNDE